VSTYDGRVQWAGAAQSAERLLEAMGGDATLARRRWAASGAMALTGRPDAAPLAGPARVALAFDQWAEQLAVGTAGTPHVIEVDGAALIGERAALQGLMRRGATSCGGGCRLLHTSDGAVAVTLARDDDVALLDAWLGRASALRGAVPLDDDDWAVIAAAVADRSVDELVQQAILLGLPCAAVGERAADTPMVAAEHMERAVVRPLHESLVIDLSSLWAGPLCANLLGVGGARIVKVESSARPDGARRGSAEFYDLLHAGHESVALDLRTAAGQQQLRELLFRADVVIEASRPRALSAMQASFSAMHAEGWRGQWVSITAHGAHGDAAMRVGFGDDAAAAGGLVAHDDEGAVFCADAIADPATGLLAATVVVGAIAEGVVGHYDVSLAGTAAHLATGVAAHDPIMAGTQAVTPPRARPRRGAAASLGEHTASVMGTR